MAYEVIEKTFSREKAEAIFNNSAILNWKNIVLSQ
jgi:hypothetical protein